MAQNKILFKSEDLCLDLRYVADTSIDDIPAPKPNIEILDLQNKGHLGPSVSADIELHEGQIITFILRCPPKEPPIPQAIPRTTTATEYKVAFECS